MATSSQTHVPPVPLVRLVERLRNSLYRTHQRLAPAPIAMVEMILAAWMSQALEVAAELGIADALVTGPLTADDLARRVGADADAVQRLMRALVSRGVFRRHRNGKYGLIDSRKPCVPTRRYRWRGRRCSTDRRSIANTGARWPRRSGRVNRPFQRCAARTSSSIWMRSPIWQSSSTMR